MVNRTSDCKYSFHIRAPGYVVKRAHLKQAVATMKFKQAYDQDQDFLLNLDELIYREKGSLRLSNNAVYYTTGLKQIHI